MIFDVNQTEFPSKSHKEVWQIGKAVLPLKVTLFGIDDPETREGCTQIYNWTQDYLEALYNNPEQFEGRNPSGMFHLLDDFMENAIIADEGIIIQTKRHEKPKYPHKAYLDDFAQAGLRLENREDTNYLICEKYPLFGKYLKLFYDAANNYKQRTQNLMLNDFRVFTKPYKRTFDDLLRTLSDKNKVYFTEMHEYAIKKRAKLDSAKYCDTYSYLYKNNSVLSLDQRACILVPYSLKGNAGNALESLLSEIKKHADKDEIIAYIQKEIVLCVSCANTSCNGRRVEVEGKSRLICVCDSIGKMRKPTQNYTDDDILLLKRILDIRFAQIDNKERRNK